MEGSQNALVIGIGGVELKLPADLHFSYTPEGSLMVDFSRGSKGKLYVRPGQHLPSFLLFSIDA